MTPTTIEALRQSPLFDRFQPKHLDRLLAIASEVSFRKDEIIFQEGEDAWRLYIILSGRVELEAEFQSRLFHVETLYAGDELGWSSVLNVRSRFRAKALEPVHAVYFESSELRDACHGDSHFGCAFFERIFAAVTERLQNTRLRLVEVAAEAESLARSGA